MSNSNVHSQQAASTEEGGEGGDDAWNPYYFMRVKVEVLVPSFCVFRCFDPF